jgi:hypothetical protein
VFLDPALADRRKRSHRSRRAGELAIVTSAEQHARVPTSSALVDVHHLRPEIGKLIDALHLEIGQTSCRVLERLLGRAHRALSLFELLSLDLAIDLAFPQIADQRPRFTRQPLGLSL